MKVKLKYVVCIMIPLFSLTCLSQVNRIIPPKFSKTTSPEYKSNEWSELYSSDYAFRVNIIKGQVNATKMSAYANKTNECKLTLSNGTLKGINNGEWGGMLSFTPNDSTNKTIEIKNGNILFVFIFKNEVYFIEGINHLSINKGALYHLEITNCKFTYKKILDFEDKPASFTIYNDELLVATIENFFRIKNFKKELVFKKEFWTGLSPYSIVVKDMKNVLLGIRGGIVKLDLTNKKFEFYKFNK
jgi:hypothetical protein